MKKINSRFSFKNICLLILICGFLFSTCWIQNILPTANAQIEQFDGYVREMPLEKAERLDAIRYCQARIVQPYSNGRYVVRAVRVLMPSDGFEGVFSYLITFQINMPENRASDLGDLYSVAGYYVVNLTRSQDDFILLDEFSFTPVELMERLEIYQIPPPPELTSDPDQFDFTDAVFDATDPDLAEWREQLVESSIPRWEWTDLTGDGILDCILDIEGFEFQPSSYYAVLVTMDYGYIEGFRSWGYDTDFSEIPSNGKTAIRVDRYSMSPGGDYLPSWRDYYIWNGMRYILANLNFASEYSEIIPALEELSESSLACETDPDGRWHQAGTGRYEINLTRFFEGSGLTSEYYFNLARLAEYQFNLDEAGKWWLTLQQYLNAEYDSQILFNPDNLDEELLDLIPAYEEWRDELYSASEAVLTEE